MDIFRISVVIIFWLNQAFIRLKLRIQDPKFLTDNYSIPAEKSKAPKSEYKLWGFCALRRVVMGYFVILKQPLSVLKSGTIPSPIKSTSPATISGVIKAK